MTQDELGSPARRVSVGGRTINVRIVRRESAGVAESSLALASVPGVSAADRYNRAVVEATSVFDSVDERIASTDLQYRNGGYESQVLTEAAEAAGQQYVRQTRAPKRGKRPSLATLEKWAMDGVAKATDGCRVEPDGTCPHGAQSWLMELGF